MSHTRGQCRASDCASCRKVATVCYMCSSECGLIVHERDGRIEGVFGDPAHPMNRGALCPKALATPELLTGDRIQTPLKRRGERGEGRFEPIGWEQALREIASSLVASKLAEGPQTLLVQFGEKPDHDLVYRFANAYGTPNVLDHDSICDTNRRQGFQLTYGASHFRPLPDLSRPLRTSEGVRETQDCRYLLLLGENPFEATRLLYLRDGILDALRAGMHLTVADPYQSASARHAHDWLKLRPGSDLALALSLLRYVVEHDEPRDPARRYLDHAFIRDWTHGFEELRGFLLGSGAAFTPEWAAARSGLDPATIRRVAHEFGSTKPAAAMVGMNGVGHHENGFLTTRAIAMLVALTGNLDVPGGLALAPRPRLAHASVHGHELLGAGLAEMHKDLFGGHPLAWRGIKAKDPRDILEGVTLRHGAHRGESYRIRSLFVIHGNPLINAPGSGRWREALTHRDASGAYGLRLVVFNDTQLNDTGLYADYVLPMASFVERQGLCSIYSLEPTISLREAVVPPLHASRVPRDWLAALTEACVAAGDPTLAGTAAYASDDAWCDALLRDCPGLPGHRDGVAPDGQPLSVAWLRSNGGSAVWPARYRKYDLLDTPSGKVEFQSLVIEAANRAYGTAYEPLLAYAVNRFSPDNPEFAPCARDFPFQLITGRSLAHTGSFTQNLEHTLRLCPEPGLEIHSEDARELGLRSGDWVWIRNPLGARLRARVTPTDALLRGVVRARHGWGQRSPFLSRAAGRGYNVNELTDAENFNPITGNAGFGDMLVALERDPTTPADHRER